MRNVLLSLLVLALIPLAGCIDEAPTAPEALAPGSALFSHGGPTDKDANFKYDGDNDDWYCVKQYGKGDKFMDDGNVDPDNPDTAETVYCTYENYEPKREL